MYKIAFVSPNITWRPFVKNIFRDHCKLYNADNQFSLDFFTPEDDRVFTVDTLLARGITAQFLKETAKEIPLVEIPIGIVDFIQAFEKCKVKYNSRDIGILLPENIICGLESLSNLIDINIRTFPIPLIKNLIDDNYDSKIEKYAREAIELALKNGCTSLIGGFHTCLCAEKMNIPNVPINYSKEIIWPCITEAKRRAREFHGLAEKGRRLETIVNQFYSGIITYDASGVIISANSLSSMIISIGKILKPGENISNAPILPAFKKVLLDTLEYSNEILHMNDIFITFSKIAIKLEDEIVSWVVAFCDTNIKKIDYAQKRQIKKGAARYTFTDIIGESPEIRQCIETAKHYAKSSNTILLTGESGTGKEIFAQSIHNESSRGEGPFVAVNCAALPETLLESELFGYEDGSFTGAVKGGKPGYFELANGGTLFLDEIGEMPISLQAKLLRVLQEKEIFRLGGKKAVTVNARTIFATNQNLNALIAQKRFREDLFFRINVLPLNIPPLRNRKKDIPLIIRNFFQKNYPKAILMDNFEAELFAYDWPGNIRQLLNISERIVALEDGDIKLDADSFYYALAFESNFEGSRAPSLSATARKSESEHITEMLKQCRYNKTQAAKMLGWDRSTLWRKMKLYNIV
jgi:transcriptional regulator with PAS, ATPase and Fis domain